MTEAEQLKRLTKNEKRFLARFECGLCGHPLNWPNCGAIFSKCDEGTRIRRRKNCLKMYKPRNKQKSRIEHHENSMLTP